MSHCTDCINYCEFTLFTRGSLYFLFFLSLVLAFGLLFTIASKKKYENEYRCLLGKMAFLEEKIKDLRSKRQNQNAPKKEEGEKEILFRIEKLLKENCSKKEEKNVNF